jgi:hypothetical protein
MEKISIAEMIAGRWNTLDPDRQREWLEIHSLVEYRGHFITQELWRDNETQVRSAIDKQQEVAS